MLLPQKKPPATAVVAAKPPPSNARRLLDLARRLASSNVSGDSDSSLIAAYTVPKNFKSIFICAKTIKHTLLASHSECNRPMIKYHIVILEVTIR